MNRKLFEQLLHEEESATLDFKCSQYAFQKADDDSKSELLKDILGFANALRRSEAYILIGVREIRGERSEVVGIKPEDQLDDHALQQFVNSLTNKPVNFDYQAFSADNMQVGIITIEHQERPIYLKRDYGKLKKEKVYMRRGSSTNPNKPASLDEIASMRSSLVAEEAEIEVEFADPRRECNIGKTLLLEGEFCQMPVRDEIPDLAPPREPSFGGIQFRTVVLEPLHNRTNREFYRELAVYEFERRLFSPVRLTLKNIGKVAAKNVWLEIRHSVDSGFLMAEGSQLCKVPQKKEDLLASVRLASPSKRNKGQVIITHDQDRFLFEVDFGDIQPGRKVFSDLFFLGSIASQVVQLEGTVFGENIYMPILFSLSVSAKVTKRAMSVFELCELSPPVEDSES
jgi:hypothetical protein